MKLEVLGVDDWHLAEHASAAMFTREYVETETCYVIAGEARLVPQDGDPVEIREGDLVTLLAGVVCTWHIHTPMKIHFHVG